MAAWDFDEPAMRTLIQSEAGSNSGCVLRPCAFFVAWNGVLTLVYTGFPPLLERVKVQLNSVSGLKAENFGSKCTCTGCMNSAV